MTRFICLFIGLMFLLMFCPRYPVPNGPRDFIVNSFMIAMGLAVVMTWIKEKKP